MNITEKKQENKTRTELGVSNGLCKHSLIRAQAEIQFVLRAAKIQMASNEHLVNFPLGKISIVCKMETFFAR